MISIDTNANETAKKFLALANAMDTIIDTRVVTVYVTDITAEAKAVHRFRRRTGRLESAIQGSVSDNIGRVFINESISKYGKYIHEGFKSWDPDKFIYNAADRIERKALKEANGEVQKTISRIF